ncbi:MAG: hypothetical protein M3O35_05385 [Acidobacteriota bacterium]|nr:hypothetical protein [Acidobacteriota bacterium]
MRTLNILGAVSLLACRAIAQPPVAPTPDPVGKPRGDNTGNYNIVDSMETGYRFLTLGGSLDQYRSMVNYGNGVRLLSSYLTMNSRDGHGRYFDEIVLTTQGLGNDPYESATLRIQKNALYRYDLTWRLNDYNNPGLRSGGADSQHLLNTRYTLQDHDFTLFPQSAFKFFLGYTRGAQGGPAISTVQLFDARGNEFPLFENVRRLRNEYRIGGEATLLGVRLNWTRGWEDFKEDSPYDLNGFSQGNNPLSSTTLTSFHRREPYHGTSPYWRVALFTERKWLAVNGRFTYTSGSRDFVLNENATGTGGRSGADMARQIVTFGNGRRLVATGNLNLSLFPTSKLTIVNSTAVYNSRIDGNATFQTLDNATLTIQQVNFQFLGIRTIANQTDVNYQAQPWLGVYGGYHYTNREFRSIEQSAFLGSTDRIPASQTNELNSGVFGVRLKPAKPLTIVLDGEVGRVNGPFTPWAENAYHLLGAHVQYKTKKFLATAFTRASYNTNSVALSSFASRQRNYAADFSWTPLDWFSLDTGYSKLHLNTVSGLAYFANSQQVLGDQSFYISNIHTFNLGVRLALLKRADLFVGYNHVQDTGDGCGTPLGTLGGSSLPAILAAQTFPLTYQTPLARVSVRIAERLRWNVGYQFYRYNEKFYQRDDFRAHTGYTSLLWSF